jgi:hypothetical protein
MRLDKYRAVRFPLASLIDISKRRLGVSFAPEAGPRGQLCLFRKPTLQATAREVAVAPHAVIFNLAIEWLLWPV